MSIEVHSDVYEEMHTATENTVNSDFIEFPAARLSGSEVHQEDYFIPKNRAVSKQKSTIEYSTVGAYSVEDNDECVTDNSDNENGYEYVAKPVKSDTYVARTPKTVNPRSEDYEIVEFNAHATDEGLYEPVIVTKEEPYTKLKVKKKYY